MFLIKLHKVILGLALWGVAYGVENPSSPRGIGGTVQATQRKNFDPNDLTSSHPSNPANFVPQVQLAPPSGRMMKVMDSLGLTKRARKPIAPIYIPKDLTGKSDDEIMGCVNMLMIQRRKIQKRMTRHIAYYGALLIILHFFGSSSFVKGGVAGLFWLNSNYRGTINADWMIHQQQLADFIVEYKRVKKMEANKLPKSWLVGAPVISLEYSKGQSTKFPIWVDAKGKRLPSDAEVRGNVALFRNWVVRK